jgi:hypothetical protein
MTNPNFFKGLVEPDRVPGHSPFGLRGGRPLSLVMNVLEEFEAHANECRRMARATRDLESKSTWNRMAERWVRLAENHRAAQGAAEGREPRTHERHDRPIYRRARSKVA